MAISKETLNWRESFEQKNDKEHKEMIKMISRIDKNVLELSIRFEGLNVMQKKIEGIDGRVEILEKFKEKKTTQLKMINYIFIVILWLISAVITLDRFLDLFKGNVGKGKQAIVKTQTIKKQGGKNEMVFWKR